MRRHCNHNKCYASMKDFSRAIPSFLCESVLRNRHLYCDEVTGNIRVSIPQIFGFLRDLGIKKGAI